ncbi:uncharacterized protein LOC5506705 isoform X1 [Nematostella vectensis]|uniref:uncharacterized protein LOC5506705 isoform X1 n=1 Tax=Nematostella vectensis TaxID=45351 RepID=UPI00207779F5|nr:uncharacterized protein LOC5506705 isoform X1 [Nematostella vectensis]
MKTVKVIIASLLVYLVLKAGIIKAGNLALRQSTKSLNIWEGRAPPHLAVDGVNMSNFFTGSTIWCFGTSPDPTHGGWWRVDLGRTHVVDEVFIISRGDCCPERLAGLEVRVGDSLVNNGIENPMCGSKITTGPISKPIYCRPGLRGRYVVLYIPGVNNRLEICEVMVNLNPSANLALNKSTAQSTTDHSGDASRAVDGNTDGDYGRGSCTHTQDQPNPWWRVDLGITQPVSEVFLVNRASGSERLHNAEVRVGDDLTDNGNTNPLCGDMFSMATLQKLSIYCKPRRSGRYVNVRLVGASMVLTLCEVEVYSESKAVILNKPPPPEVPEIYDIEATFANFTCPEAFGYPVPDVAWVLNGKVYQNGSSRHFRTPALEGVAYGDLTLECIVSNKHGSDFYQFPVKHLSHLMMCRDHQTKNHPTRAVTYKVTGSYSNDGDINETVWRRYEAGSAPMQLAESCVPTHRCNTKATGWMTEPHPSARDGVVQRTVCFHWDDDCCRYQTQIFVRRCHGFYVYRLKALKFAVEARYCTRALKTLYDESILMSQYIPPSGHDNYALRSHAVAIEQDVTVEDCVMFCMLDRRCQSLNYVTSSKTCEINNSTRHESEDDVTLRAGVLHYESVQFIQVND